MNTNNPLKILVIDDDPTIRTVMTKHFKGHDLDFAIDASGAARKIESGRYDICFIDLQLGKNDPWSGLDLIPKAVEKGFYSVVMTGHDSDKFVEQAHTLGCSDFYPKGIGMAANLDRVMAKYAARSQAGQWETLFKDRVVTVDPNTKTEIERALKYAATDQPILILGPSGTGKTNLAKVLHENSGRAGNFVSINCSAYNDDLLETELFGFRKGAFSGAAEAHDGKLSLANKGTLFLDEIGSMSPKMQSKLLKAIEEKCFYPVNSNEPLRSDFRVISATLEATEKLAEGGAIRPDLWQRINGLAVTLTPLADRPCDIFPLIEFFTRGGKRLCFTPEAKQALLDYGWPGNIRELRKVIDLLVLGHEGRVTVDDLAPLLGGWRPQTATVSATERQYESALNQGLDKAVEQFVDSVIARNLQRNGGQRRTVLRELQIGSRALYASLNRTSCGAEELQTQ